MDTEANSRDRLVATAMQMIHFHGYAALGVQEICSQAGVSKSSFYHFFPSKEALAVAVIDARWKGLGEALGPMLGSDMRPLNKLRAFFSGLYEVSEEIACKQGAVLGCPFGSLGSELAASSPAVRERVAGVFDGTTRLFGDLLRAAVNAGELPSEFSVEAGAEALLTLMQGMGVVGRIYNSPERLRQIGEEGVARILRVAKPPENERLALNSSATNPVPTA